MKVIITALTLLIWAQADAQDSKQMTFKVEGWSCQGCANSTATALQKIKGVNGVKAVFDKSSATMVTDGTVSEEKIKAILAGLNFQAFFEGDEKIAPLTKEETSGLDIRVVKGGDKIKFEDYLATGKLTIFDFYADWCGPCKLFTPKLERLIFEHPDLLSLVQVDVVDWKSQMAKHLTNKYQLPALPFALIFDDQGKLISRIEGNNIEAVKSAIASK